MGIWNKLSGTGEVVGVDIGSHSIKMVQLKESRQGIVLHKAGSKPVPPDSIKAGVVTNPRAVADAIREMSSALGIGACGAVAGVAGPAVVVRQVQLPAMSERHLRRSIQWEARNYISFPVEDSVLEFQIQPGDGRSGHIEVTLVATPRDMVESRVETLELAGLDPLAIEIEAFASMRCQVEWPANGEADSETIALVGVGHSFTDIDLVQAGKFVLTRMIPLAGNALTEAVGAALGVDPAKAGSLKETAMRVVLSEDERATLDPFAQQASRAAEPLLEELVREIRRSLAYYDYQQQGSDEKGKPPSVSRVVLSGGSALLAGLREYLQAQLGVPVEIANPFREGAIQAETSSREYLQSHSPGLVVGTGLALRELMLTNGKGHRKGAK
jgi:type IV pilus assembly protein PilM